MTGCNAESADDPDAPPAMLSSELRDIVLAPDTTLVSGLVPRSTTLDTLLRGHGVADDAAVSVVHAARQVFDPRRLRALQPFSIERTLEGTLRFFQYEIDNDRFLRVAPSPSGSGTLDATVVPIPKTLEHASASGRIDAETPSLFQSVADAGEGAELAVALAQVFSARSTSTPTSSPATATRSLSTSSRAKAAPRATARSPRPSSATTVACCTPSASRSLAASARSSSWATYRPDQPQRAICG